MQENNYYPFGMNLEGNWNGAAGNNKYQYNGKEWNDDFGLSWNHHDWRFYDVAIGRFVTLDPESETGVQRSWNPYHFSLDNPIRYSDPDGRNPIPIILRIVGRRLLAASLKGSKPPPRPVINAMQQTVRKPSLTGKPDNVRVIVRPLPPPSSAKLDARSDNKLHPDPDATGDHSTYAKDDDGMMTVILTNIKNGIKIREILTALILASVSMVVKKMVVLDNRIMIEEREQMFQHLMLMKEVGM